MHLNKKRKPLEGRINNDLMRLLTEMACCIWRSSLILADSLSASSRLPSALCAARELSRAHSGSSASGRKRVLTSADPITSSFD